MKVKSTNSYSVSIFIAGDYQTHVHTCQSYCDRVGLCVTVTPTNYVYTGGAEDGVIVGLINYARFPKTREEIYNQALELAGYLRVWSNQDSFTIQDDTTSTFYSWRETE